MHDLRLYKGDLGNLRREHAGAPVAPFRQNELIYAPEGVADADNGLKVCGGIEVNGPDRRNTLPGDSRGRNLRRDGCESGQEATCG